VAIDYWTLVKDFKVGDYVQRLLPGSGSVTPFYGRVTAVLSGIGFVDVQWPFANERVSPEELLRVRPEAASYVPPQLDFSYYPGWDATKQASRSPRAAAFWAREEVPANFHHELARVFNAQVSELDAYGFMWDRFSSTVPDHTLRGEVAKFYRVANNLGELFFEQLALKKEATYWSAPGRQHRATPDEVATCKPLCPKCKKLMRKATYKMLEGQRVKLFACPKCLYLIRQDDIFGPDGAQVEW
jgi:hypothetical protein